MMRYLQNYYLYDENPLSLLYLREQQKSIQTIKVGIAIGLIELVIVSFSWLDKSEIVESSKAGCMLEAFWEGT